MEKRLGHYFTNHPCPSFGKGGEEDSRLMYKLCHIYPRNPLWKFDSCISEKSALGDRFIYIREIRFGSSIHVYQRNPLWKFDSCISEKSALEVRFIYIREIRFGSSIHIYPRNPLWKFDSCISEKSALGVRFMYIREIRFGRSIHVMKAAAWSRESSFPTSMRRRSGCGTPLMSFVAQAWR